MSSPQYSLQRQQGEPLARLAAWRTMLGNEDALLLVDFEFQPYWPGAAEAPALTAIYCQLDGALRVSVTDRDIELGSDAPAVQYRRWLQQHQLPDAVPGEPLALQPLHIPKPWGQEIWYTGVEERGVCSFALGGRAVPIPWLQAVMPADLAGPPGQPLVLLKILDPAAEEVTGDLYFELHEEKREVYVVTRVDPAAWPDGVGYIRYGFDPARVAAAGSDEDFRRQYREAVAAYELVRRQIDALAPDEAPAPSQVEQERQLRQAMNDFTSMCPLSVGDVVVVPLLMPHSLQHGVRTVEFQTPVYERQILSFAQQVLTQDHWDTDDAVDQMRLTPPPQEPFARLLQGDGVQVERIVDFEDFEVQRVRLAPGGRLPQEALSRYALVMVVEGELSVAEGKFGPEQALFLPAGWAGQLRGAQSAQPVVFLLAMPRG